MLRIGTSGWQYSHWRRRFYPPDVAMKHWLEYYAARFETVEVNNTFYRLPSEKTFADWNARVPEKFTYAIKASNYLTHYRRLRDPDEAVARLLQRSAPLRSKLAVVLLQLPPNLKSAPDDLDATLEAFGSRVRVAVEPRHPSWFCDDVRSVLTRHGAALCLADRGSRMTTPSWNTAGWAYIRFHFGRANPESCYGEKALRRWVDRLVEEFTTEVDGFVYFNNDAHGCALRDAIAFGALAREAGIETTRVASRSELSVP
jgi:uncharacterized protein YecE (DUF72 family)